MLREKLKSEEIWHYLQIYFKWFTINWNKIFLMLLNKFFFHFVLPLHILVKETLECDTVVKWVFVIS